MKKKVMAVLAAASLALALASCGSGDSSKEGTVSLGTSDTSKAAEPAADSTAESAPEAESQTAEESQIAEESAPAAESEASGDRTPEVAADAPFAEKFRFRYNGADFYVGEKFF